MGVFECAADVIFILTRAVTKKVVLSVVRAPERENKNDICCTLL